MIYYFSHHLQVRTIHSTFWTLSTFIITKPPPHYGTYKNTMCLSIIMHSSLRSSTQSSIFPACGELNICLSIHLSSLLNLHVSLSFSIFTSHQSPTHPSIQPPFRGSLLAHRHTHQDGRTHIKEEALVYYMYIVCVKLQHAVYFLKWVSRVFVLSLSAAEILGNKKCL